MFLHEPRDRLARELELLLERAEHDPLIVRRPVRQELLGPVLLRIFLRVLAEAVHREEQRVEFLARVVLAAHGSP